MTDIWTRRIENAWHDLTSHHGHHPYPEQQHPVQKGTPAMSIITDLANASAKVDEGIKNIEGWFDDYKPKAAAVIAEAQRIDAQVTGDPFIQGYLGAELAVPEHLVSVALDFLGKLVSVDKGAAAPAVTPAEPVAEPAADASAN